MPSVLGKTMDWQWDGSQRNTIRRIGDQIIKSKDWAAYLDPTSSIHFGDGPINQSWQTLSLCFTAESNGRGVCVRF